MSLARSDCSSNVISTTTVLVTPAASYVDFQPLKNITNKTQNLHKFCHRLCHSSTHEYYRIHYKHHDSHEHRNHRNRLPNLHRLINIYRNRHFNLLCHDHSIGFGQHRRYSFPAWLYRHFIRCYCSRALCHCPSQKRSGRTSNINFRNYPRICFGLQKL